MNELPISILKDIRKYKPIKTDGLTLYPILVSEYDEFSMAVPALEVLHQSLPVALLRVPLLSALYQMDFDALKNGQTPTGLFARARLLLALSFRLGQGMEIAERIDLIQVVVSRNEPNKLIGLRFMDGAGETKEVTPAQFKTLREIIAAQNGIELESDMANPAIVQAKKDMNAGGPKLDANVDDLISAIAILSRTDEEIIETWPILKFQKRSESCRRILDYLVCGIGETNGATWKNGNPTPHPFFKKISDGDGLFTPLGSTGNVETPGSVKQTIQQTQNL